MKIGIIGCGVIGTEIAKFADSDGGIDAVCLYDIDKAKSKILQTKIRKAHAVSLEELIEHSDLVIEAASPKAMIKILKECIDKKKDIMVMSTAGFIGNTKLIEDAERRGIKIHMPSGAIAGIDAVKAASLANITDVTLRTTKPPQGLEGAPYIIKNNIDLASLKKSTLIFSGSAEDAGKAFPKNINVSATLSLAISTRAFDKVKVEIIADPKQETNQHEIIVKGDFGTITTKTENMPSPNNPKTSFLAALSAVAKLKEIL